MCWGLGVSAPLRVCSKPRPCLPRMYSPPSALSPLTPWVRPALSSQPPPETPSPLTLVFSVRNTTSPFCPPLPGGAWAQTRNVKRSQKAEGRPQPGLAEEGLLLTLIQVPRMSPSRGTQGWGGRPTERGGEHLCPWTEPHISILHWGLAYPSAFLEPVAISMCTLGEALALGPLY